MRSFDYAHAAMAASGSHGAEALGDAARPLDGLTVGYFGHYDPGYARNRILAKALQRAGAEIVHVRDQGRFPSRTPRLIRCSRLVDFDVMLVGFPGHSDMLTARLVSVLRSAPVILDLFTSLWEAAVLDRRQARQGGIRDYRARLTDRLAYSLAHTVLFDTQSHIDWFRAEFAVRGERFHRVWAGADDEIMRPRERTTADRRFTVFFYGTFIPLHGIEHILRAARLLEREGEDVRVVVCGSGQTEAEMHRLAATLELATVEFLGRRTLAELCDLVSRSDLCLGIFGTGAKAQRVIPNKVFDALACKRAVITGDTPAARECLTHREDAWLCPVGDPEALAEAVLALKEDEYQRGRIAAAGHRLFQRRFSLDATARELAGIVLKVLDSPRA
jgi:glycosyltransferase involved in cell wall biosynthesis